MWRATWITGPVFLCLSVGRLVLFLSFAGGPCVSRVNRLFCNFFPFAGSPSSPSSVATPRRDANMGACLDEQCVPLPFPFKLVCLSAYFRTTFGMSREDTNVLTAFPTFSSTDASSPATFHAPPETSVAAVPFTVCCINSVPVVTIFSRCVSSNSILAFRCCGFS